MPAHRLRSSAFGLLAIAVGAMALLSTAPSAASAQGWPPEIKNLQHFPEDTEFGELIGYMRDLATGLGVRCQFCHVGEAGQPLAEFDFASDEKPTKRKARVMLAMVDAINSQHLANLPERGTPAVEVTCATCHSGKSRPVTLQAELTHVRTEEGVEAAIARYRELREETYGSYSYNFVNWTLESLAVEWAANDWNDDAIAMLEFNQELYPESVQTPYYLGQLHMQGGDNDKAIAYFERALEISPNHGPAQRFLDQLKGGG